MNDPEFKIKKLKKGDELTFQKLILMFHEVFETNSNIPNLSYLKGLLANSAFVAYVIIHEDEVIGGLTAYELPMYYADSSELFIYDIAVKATFQRKGLGKKLLSSLGNYCKIVNAELMFVASNEEDKHAVEFYHSIGGKSEKVVHFNYNIE